MFEPYADHFYHWSDTTRSLEFTPDGFEVPRAGWGGAEDEGEGEGRGGRGDCYYGVRVCGYARVRVRTRIFARTRA